MQRISSSLRPRREREEAVQEGGERTDAAVKQTVGLVRDAAISDHASLLNYIIPDVHMLSEERKFYDCR